MGLQILILAAGKGTRMRSRLPKVLHLIGGKPMLSHVIDTAKGLQPDLLAIVTGFEGERIRTTFSSEHCVWVDQGDPKGTGHAVQTAMPALNSSGRILILYGDVPLLGLETLQQLLNVRAELTLLTTRLEKPQGYGRILRDDTGSVVAIREEKDCSEDERQCQEVNTGILVVDRDRLDLWLPRLTADNKQKEFYLTDIVSMAVEDGARVETVSAVDTFEVQGINDREQLSLIERHFQRGRAAHYMREGVTFSDPERVDFRGSVVIGKDCSVDVNVIFEGHCVIGDNVQIGPFCVIRNAQIAAGCRIESFSHIDSSTLGPNCVVGPYARLRPDTKLDESVRIGNFVEVKKARIGIGSKVNHLSYIGDAVVGSKVNVGAGTITCNYDGVNKHQTVLEDGVFIGSNSALVAPVTIGENATIGAGSVITRSVGANSLALTRVRQHQVEGWKRPVKKSDRRSDSDQDPDAGMGRG